MIKYSFQILSDLIQQLIYFIHILYKYNRKTKIDIKKGELIIIANGPSVKTKMPEIKKRSENTSVMGMNFIALSPDFYELKPSYYCLADPMFFVDTHRKTEAINLLHALDNNVTWKLKIYVPYNFSNKVNSFFKFTNENISIVVVNNCRYGGFNFARNYFYKIGLSCPEIYSVIIMAIYAGIKSKFSSIYLYGVDHTFFDKLQVNSSNELSSVYKHFDTNEFRLKKIIRIDNGEKWKISDYIIEKGLLFKSHDYLRSFANHMDVSIINCTKSSLIDSYVRESS